MAEPELIEYYRAKVIGFQIEAHTTPEGPGRAGSLNKMADFYIKQIEATHKENQHG